MKENSSRLITLAVVLVVALLGIIAPAQAETVGKDVIYSTSNPIPEIAARVRPAVVQVISQQETWTPQYGRMEEAVGSGSGVYIDDRGYIVTNYHVVEDADRVEVELLDGTVLEVVEVLSDESTDIALLKLESPLEGVEPVVMGDSDALVIGELAVVIGNPGALTDVYPGTVTAGIISGLERENVNAGNFSRAVNVIQMDAAINGGNSGGALLNAKGELVGIPTLKIDMTHYGTSIEGMGFAIPVNLVRDVTASLIEYGKVPRPRMGVQVVDFEGPDEPLRDYPPAGVQILEVEEGAPAEAAGLRMYDIITHVNGARVRNYTQMSTHLDRYMEGDTVTLTVYRCYDPLSAQLIEKSRRESLELTVELKMLD